jgi:hypothetical protein
MPIAASLAVAVVAASSSIATAPPAATPPVTAIVSVAPNISASLVTRVLAEAADIWSAAGITLAWTREVPSEVTRSMLRVVIGHVTGPARDDAAMPLGWIAFDDGSTPRNEIYVSYANAMSLLQLTRGTAGLSDRMPRAEMESMLGRAMGRALAHEVGHYLLASKDHSKNGLMKARWTAAEFFGGARGRFNLDAEQSGAIAARTGLLAVASLQSPVVGPQSSVPSQSSPTVGQQQGWNRRY